jgi:sugar/nucleoside kinase (ribokinase family)
MPVELTVVGSISLDLVARVEWLPRAGETVSADEALTGFREAGIELELERPETTRGVALIFVDARGENQIVVPGANSALTLRAVGGAVVSRLEVSTRSRARGRRTLAPSTGPPRATHSRPRWS